MRESSNIMIKPTIGFNETISVIQQLLIKYYTESEYKRPFLQVIKGKIGSGKTAFMRHLLNELTKIP